MQTEQGFFLPLYGSRFFARHLARTRRHPQAKGNALDRFFNLPNIFGRGVSARSEDRSRKRQRRAKPPLQTSSPLSALPRLYRGRGGLSYQNQMCRQGFYPSALLFVAKPHKHKAVKVTAHTCRRTAAGGLTLTAAVLCGKRLLVMAAAFTYGATKPSRVCGAGEEWGGGFFVRNAEPLQRRT